MIIEMDQGSPEWLAMRSGMCTASRVADAMSYLSRNTKTGKKGEESASRQNYKWELVLERITGLTAEHFVSEPMKWGMDFEPLARERYAKATGVMPRPIGFAVHDNIRWFGASPDSLLGEDGLLEIKCPKPQTHLRYLNDGVVPEDYKPQMLAEMACSGRKWADFVSFDPRMPEQFQLFIRRFHRNDSEIAVMEEEVGKFLAEVDALTERLRVCSPLTDDLTGILNASLKEAKHV